MPCCWRKNSSTVSGANLTLILATNAPSPGLKTGEAQNHPPKWTLGLNKPRGEQDKVTTTLTACREATMGNMMGKEEEVPVTK